MFTNNSGLKYFATNLPSGLVIDRDTGIISGTPNFESVAAGAHSIVISAVDYPIFFNGASATITAGSVDLTVLTETSPIQHSTTPIAL